MCKLSSVLLSAFLLLFLLPLLSWAGFSDPGITVTSPGVCAWGDYDGDGKMDLVAGSKLYHNEGGSFTLVKDLVGACMWCYCYGAAWGDFDNDGDLDVVVSYDVSYGSPPYGHITTLEKNQGGQFSGVLIGGISGVVDVGDYDNDGYLDIAVEGASGQNIFRNNHNMTFTDTGLNIGGSWGDFDKDGDLDLNTGSKIYRNTSGVFSQAVTSLPGGPTAWGDYDNDGDLDLVDGNVVYRNDASTFSSAVTLEGTSLSRYIWADYDNDGFLDLTGGGKLYRNNIDGTFTKTTDSFVAYTPAWGDFDGDGDLDLAATDRTTSPYQSITCRIYRNDCSVVNTAPAAPSGLTATRSDSTVTFSWNASSDSQTPAGGLSYNLRVGTTPGGCNLVSGMASSTGKRLLPAAGNTGNNLGWVLKNVPAGPIFWSVQAIDSGYAGSAWAEEQIVGSSSLSDVKKAADTATVLCGPLVVTKVTGNSFYAEKTDRSSAIRVDKVGHGMTPGKKVDFTGSPRTDTSTGERYVLATSVDSIGDGAVDPLGIGNQALGGCAYGLQNGITNAGLNNTGLLVRVWGCVTQIDTEGNYFYIDDGSGIMDGTSTDGETNVGVRIVGDGRSYTSGDFIVVSGISSSFVGDDGQLKRIIR